MQQDQGGIENMIPSETCETKAMKTPINTIAEELNQLWEHLLIPGRTWDYSLIPGIIWG